jgi:hypothetical protein
VENRSTPEWENQQNYIAERLCILEQEGPVAIKTIVGHFIIFIEQTKINITNDIIQILGSGMVEHSCSPATQKVEAG